MQLINTDFMSSLQINETHFPELENGSCYACDNILVELCDQYAVLPQTPISFFKSSFLTAQA